VKIDLHIHTKTGSDGNLSVEEVFKEAKSEKISEIFESQKRQFEPVVEVLETNHVIIDTTLPMEETIRQVLEKIEEKG